MPPSHRLPIVLQRRRNGSPPHHAEGVSSTRRGEGSGVGGSYAGEAVDFAASRDLTLTSRLHPTPAPPHQGEGNPSALELRQRFYGGGQAPMKKRVGILISGRGSNMMALVEAARAPTIRPRSPSSSPTGRTPPASHGRTPPAIKALAIDHKALRNPRGVRRRRRAALARRGRRPRLPRRLHAHPERPAFVARWLGRAAQHPPLAAAGLQGPAPARAGARRRACGSRGCTVHFVTPGARRRPDHRPGGGAGA